MIYKKIPLSININQLVTDVNNIIQIAGWKEDQIALQYASKPDWHDGIGKSDMLSNDEQSYVHIHPDLEETYIKHLLLSLGFPISHARLMRIKPRCCYSTHVDYYTRYHIPVISRPLQSFMIFPDKDVILRMHPGEFYWTDTHELHNFINGSWEDRIHIVFNNAFELKNTTNPYLDM